MPIMPNDGFGDLSCSANARLRDQTKESCILKGLSNMAILYQIATL